jgi:hypothetical protein
MPSVAEKPSRCESLRKARVTTVALWSAVIILAAGAVGYVMTRAIAGASAWQYGYLIQHKRRVTIPSSYEPLTWDDFLALPALPKAYGAADWDTVQAYSARGVSLEGYIAETLRMRDGDLHVHLRSTPSPQCFPKGHREEQIVMEITPAFQPPTTGWSSAVLQDLCERQLRVRIAGWLMHDFPHTGDHTWRATMWEIHPVTCLEVWDDAHHAWQVIP